jgi:hypothetical protein
MGKLKEPSGKNLLVDYTVPQAERIFQVAR